MRRIRGRICSLFPAAEAKWDDEILDLPDIEGSHKVIVLMVNSRLTVLLEQLIFVLLSEEQNMAKYKPDMWRTIHTIITANPLVPGTLGLSNIPDPFIKPLLIPAERYASLHQEATAATKLGCLIMHATLTPCFAISCNAG